jgi:enamine deaminase RidA (YjgF/YER057c/UK114 family)
MNEAERAAGLPPTAQYQYVERVGNQLFIAGQVPNNAQGQIVGLDDPHAQALQCLRNLNTLLTVHGFSISDVGRRRPRLCRVVGRNACYST